MFKSTLVNDEKELMRLVFDHKGLIPLDMYGMTFRMVVNEFIKSKISNTHKENMEIFLKREINRILSELLAKSNYDEIMINMSIMTLEFFIHSYEKFFSPMFFTAVKEMTIYGKKTFTNGIVPKLLRKLMTYGRRDIIEYLIQILPLLAEIIGVRQIAVATKQPQILRTLMVNSPKIDVLEIYDAALNSSYDCIPILCEYIEQPINIRLPNAEMENMDVYINVYNPLGGILMCVFDCMIRLENDYPALMNQFVLASQFEELYNKFRLEGVFIGDEIIKYLIAITEAPNSLLPSGSDIKIIAERILVKEYKQYKPY